MIFRYYNLGYLSHASYLIGDEETATAVVVYSQRGVDQYMADAGKFGLVIQHLFLSHFHADFVAGHLELRDRTGAQICLGKKAEFDFAAVHLANGETLDVGQVRFKVLETPGHTPKGVSILGYDLAREAANPHSVLTGDTLFIGDVGRPDLLGSLGVAADDLVKILYKIS